MIDFIVGFTVAILSGLGIGGGGLLVIWLVLFSGFEQLEAQGVNLVWFLFSSGAAMVVHLMRRKLNFKLIGWLALCGSIGAVVGSLLAKSVSPDIIRSCFGVLLVVSGALALFKK